MHGHKHGWGGWHGAGRGRGRGNWNPFDPGFNETINNFVNETIQGAMRGGRRMFDGGELRLVLLKLIEGGPRHGYDLIRAIEEMTGGAYAPSPGVVYPTLTLLADMELIAEQQSEGARKLYAITPAGEAHLAERAEEVAALMARLEGVGEMRERSDRGPVRRAMGNLKSALQSKLRGEDGNTELPHQIAEIIDEAVRKIERL
ncbi:PadR family transcriptional regulator [Sphingobium nicotianae]|uniref:PadR family transcriptional regulator n=1 Tax=Sphingobium nicotianae TaxID=2782607 RepID=A0A9X1AJV9_9SPHN|nr:PadR family transcriptional regulator [Sphingobium nicotianae]MBT2185863.1 PadR family transcriptional regulator [Sphingobium nicotianae]